MFLRLIEDMNRALDANCYLAALSIGLILPDICGKAAYPEMKVGDRYKKWFDENIAPYERPPFDNKLDIEMPYLSGEVVYQLRNSYLHQGNPNVEKEKIKDPRNRIDHFQLIIQQKNALDIYGDTAYIADNNYRKYCVNVRRLCLIIGRTAEGYYKNNKEKFNFFNYSIIVPDKEVE